MTLAPLAQSRLLLTAIPGPRSIALHAEREKQVTTGFGVALPIFVERAQGAILQDVDGNRIIDFASGIAVTSVGASNPRVQAHVGEQLEKFTHTCFMVTEYDSFTAVCRWLNEHTPGDFEKRTALFSTGSEAIENAVKVARSATGRQRVLVFDDAYHGRSLLTMAMTAKENPYKLNFGPFPTEVVRAPFASPLRWPTGAENATADALAAVERILAQNGPETFAAMVVEPIQGEGGFIVPSPGFLPGLRDIATKHGIVLVLDEVQAGMGRTGALFASDYEQIAGDITVTAKALGGGLPLSAITGRIELMNAVHTGGLGGTYAGNPLACAAALGVFEALEDGSLVENARRIEVSARDILEPLRRATSIVADVRGRGAMLAVEFADTVTLLPRADLTKKIAALCHANGLLVLICGTFSNVLRLLPPLVIEENVLNEGLTLLRDMIQQVSDSANAAQMETVTA
ncbi:aminotransferase class III-fold pyridoxal phosphate-dependent enzyme [Cryobacterium psychrophilum]|uniref:(S)-3-amino-2-methylpropionate transaminase n=1 Tax=Cryobacterium psychrophilum TaxID=41988 RepID=A0A4Y8KS30_9MICO|nr:aminotransferase class III-fold pyridoxal phosphate-dependent enzyme [Cryobacterium psychrophilum]TDW28773.1 4-aminobutyrate aminotransferase/(S)-3-amino-2-methylpropionate transaminase [Cryobacterium psychrophilum]TFD82424.1 aminotransferase class III-fold pyridoxal phosphate-dependent enzyme [Cryobacterium psychrophilum]